MDWDRTNFRQAASEIQVKMTAKAKAPAEPALHHVRTGKHDITAFDWEQYLTFADKQFKK